MGYYSLLHLLLSQYAYSITLTDKSEAKILYFWGVGTRPLCQGCQGKFGLPGCPIPSVGPVRVLHRL